MASPSQGMVFRKADARGWDAVAALTAAGSRGGIVARWDRAGSAAEALRPLP